MVPPVASRPGGSHAAASRTILELTAAVMEAAFETLGEGTVLGTMPGYLERFGGRNALYLQRRFVASDARRGAVEALAPLQVVSQVTGTRVELVEATAARATKRLHSCEFEQAFHSRAPFAKAMVCQLHRAVYQGSVNAGIAEPGQGYDVALRSRILFGDAHCDFVVQSRSPRPAEGQAFPPLRVAPSPGDQESQARHFYAAILVALIDYLCTVLPAGRVEAMLLRCADQVGAKLHGLLAPELGEGTALGRAAEMAELVLDRGGRTVGRPAPATVVVRACPDAEPIRSATRDRSLGAALPVRAAACSLCLGVVRGASVVGAGPGTQVERTSCLTLGDSDCTFRLAGGAA